MSDLPDAPLSRLARISRRAVLSLALAAAAAPTLADAPRRAPAPAPRPSAEAPAPAALVEERRFSGEVGYAVLDLATGEVLDSRLPDRGFPPASTIKLVTALYGLDALGPDHRFETRILAHGPLSGGVLTGDLHLVGGGDPELDSDDMMALAEQVATSGLARVDGNFRVDAAALPTLTHIDPGQPEYVAYNPSVSGVNLNFNRVLFEWSGGARDLTLTAHALTARPAVASVAIDTAETVDAVFDYRVEPMRESWTVASAALRRKGKRWLPVRRPAEYAADVFRTLAGETGVLLPPGRPGAAPAGGTLVGRVESRPLRDMTRLMLKHSTNLTAEAIGLSATRASGVRPASLAESGRAMADWARGYAGIEDRGTLRAPGSLFAARASAGEGAPMRFANHSGLSVDTRITPRQLVEILAAAEARGAGLPEILEPLNLKARKGEAPPPPNAEGWAKTGTMHFVRGLGGYIDAASGRRLAFAIFAEDLDRRAAAAEGRERPRGARAWLARARTLEHELTRAWAARY